MSNPLSSEQQIVFENEVLKVIECNPKLSKVTPQTALRFFRDRKFNPKQTIAYIEKNQKWREQMDIDSINVSHVHEQLRTGKFIFTGAVDKKNRPIILFNAAKHDPKVDFFKTLTLAAYAFELAIKSMPEGIEELVIVENLDGFKTENADNRMVKYLLEISQSHYPGRIAKFYAVNAPWYYKVVYKVVKPWLSEELLNKISIESDTSKLKQDVDVSLLPRELGGSDVFDIESWINQRAQIENLNLQTPTPLNVAPEILATFSDIAAKDLIPSSRKHGWIKKQGGYVKTFNKRYCVLTDFILYYFKEQNDPKPEGFVELQGAKVATKKGNVFEITTAVDKVCIFSAKSDKEFKEWAEDVATAINELNVNQL